MEEIQTMSLDAIRAELREMGVSERLMKLILREMAAAEERVAQKPKNREEPRYDPLRAQLFVLKANGMTNPDLTLNRKGMLFITLTTREEMEKAA